VAWIGRCGFLQGDGKRVIVFGGEVAFDPASVSSDTFQVKWPPRSGREQLYPEINCVEWFDLETAKTKMLSAQVELLDRPLKPEL
jgi:predicted NUDIX family NTP pyrophosphohydrolase